MTETAPSPWREGGAVAWAVRGTARPRPDHRGWVGPVLEARDVLDHADDLAGVAEIDIAYQAALHIVGILIWTRR